MIAESLPPDAGAPTAGCLELNADMRRHTSWRVGGPADRLYRPARLEDLCAFLGTLRPGEPVHFIGLGSNLLVRDGGIRGTVIHMHAALNALRIDERRRERRPNQGPARMGVVYAEAGVASPRLARFAASHDLVNAEFMAGIPGTVGGALAMNAGCHGQETWAYVSQVLCVNRRGELFRRSPNEFHIAYRHAQAKEAREEWYVAAWFLFPRGDGQASREEIRRLLQRRQSTQPLNQPNAGSVFRNPPGDHAARLIEHCGLKGLRVGNAQVSEKHANFIVNLGQARAADIEDLIETVQTRVAARTGVRLQREVHIIGEKPCVQ
ncbi:MAG TPA: UDP-N-acetylmuramate dehydrogenase [Thiobacillaceae bacterium]|nr:UDP-N-acetylmuramate dehydrogenase [Thiobacillaceae bacterium]HNU63716.1 UDP-N-acetylmuramate dehydrogenase [Thiobacillaceae bacterium]